MKAVIADTFYSIALTLPRDAADLLSTHGGPSAAGWNAESVRELYRQGMCSLASRMIKAGSHE